MELLNAIAATARRLPDKVAATDNRRTLTFRDVAVLSDGLARRLHEARAEENQVVGYLGGADITLLIASLAILKAGQCILVINPQDPVASLRDLARHAGMRSCVAGPGFEALAEQVTRVAGTPWLAGLLVAAPFAAVMSSVDSFLLMISSALVRDIYQRNINPRASEQAMKRMVDIADFYNSDLAGP